MVAITIPNRQPILSPRIVGDAVFSRRIDVTPSPVESRAWWHINDRLARRQPPSGARLLHRRDVNSLVDTDSSEHLVNLLLLILGVAFLTLLFATLTVLFRRRRGRRGRRRCRQQAAPHLPTYAQAQQHASLANIRGLTIETTRNGRSSILRIDRDGHPMLQNPHSPPHSPENVPDIHITFPDEPDEHGQPQTGRVLVVRVGDNAALGLEPMHGEQLPAYEKEAKVPFHPVDLDRVGGLKEKDAAATYQ